MSDAYAGHRDMLHDTERNELYEAGVLAALDELKRSHLLPAHSSCAPLLAIDIGCGSGLLGCLVAKLAREEGGSASVRIASFEVVHELSQLARRVVSRNGFDNTIRVVCAHSTEAEVAGAQTTDGESARWSIHDEHGDEHVLPRARLIVHELLDTGLLGEGLFAAMRPA